MTGNPKNSNPLHDALVSNNPELASSIIQAPGYIDNQDEYGETPLFLAVEFENVFEMLIYANADVNIPNNYGETPLHKTAEYGTLSECRLLLIRGANVHARDQNGRTSLHMAALYGKYEIVKLLVDHNSAVNECDKQGKTPLHYAVFGNILPHELNNHVLTAEILIHAGADLQVKTNEGETPLELARKHTGYPELADLLVRYGAR